MEEQKQRDREHILGQIPGTISNFLRMMDSTAVRILGDNPNSVLNYGDYLESIRSFISEVQRSIHMSHPDAQTHFLAVNMYRGKHSYFVLDLNNVSYAYETAHTDMTPVPVYVLRLSKR
ncbi:hypothetical protein BDV24DRAFT_121895 [Aspergillus arachidicola]|uniref:Uncharacterized protein n=1 Tax=Aspergillus arachidicola TaxID=656916 RepID=A0A5N6YSD7_9EURO|nr:hypothetical protein BDV24DRAFT_121895 [Aspergillus arachidicola]